MSTCKACDRQLLSEMRNGISCCPNCRWPRNLATLESQKLAEEWANSMHRQYSEVSALLESTDQSVDSSTIGNLSSKITCLEEDFQKVEEFKKEVFRKVEVLEKEMHFLQDSIGHDQQMVGRVEYVEGWCRSAHDDIVAIQQKLEMAIDSSININSSTPMEILIDSEFQHPIENLDNSLNAETTKVSLSVAEQELVNSYNRLSADELLGSTQEVSPEDSALARLRNGDNSKITFYPKQTGTFLVICSNGYYLVPNKKRDIKPIGYKIVKVIYECSGYDEDHDYSELILVKPAVLQKISEELWQLSQPGVLKFI
jgi:uncharacterized Zn finger protein (UPF0148 family)